MFETLNIIEKQLKRQHFIVLITIILAVLSLSLISIYFLSKTFSGKKVVYAIDNAGNAIVLREIDEDPIQEAQGQFKDFHRLFFNLPPDGKQIQNNIQAALNLVDESGKAYYNTFKENHYYNKLVASNINQCLVIDSIIISEYHPYKVRLWGKILLIRPSMTIERSLITQGQLRRTQRSTNAPHGFLIEKFSIVELKDLKTYKKE